MRTTLILAAGLAAVLTGCTPKAAAPAADDTATPAETAAADACPDDGPRLAGTGLCAGRAVNYLDPYSDWEPPEGCGWVMNEAMIGDGSEALLYRAAECNGVVTQLEVSAGAHSASVMLVQHAEAGDAWAGQEVIRLFTAPADNPQFALQDILSNLPDDERAICEIQNKQVGGWPSDALVIGPTEAARATMPTNEPIAACGDFGLNEDASNYWVIKQGLAWFFTLGQEDPGFDAQSIQLMRKEADGDWFAVE